jgi:hypothetical protein
MEENTPQTARGKAVELEKTRSEMHQSVPKEDYLGEALKAVSAPTAPPTTPR